MSRRRRAGAFVGGGEVSAASDSLAARDCFRSLRAARSDDAPARLYLSLCEEAISHPPDEKDFDGVIRLTEK